MSRWVRPDLFDLVAISLETDGQIVDTHAGNDLIDQFDVHMQTMEPSHHRHVHRFTPGLYIREIFMPAGMLCVSKVHNTEHPYIISKGVVSVFIPGKGVDVLSAPHTGITLPGTRRLLYIHEDVIWTTFHPTDLTDLEEIEQAIIRPYTNHRLASSDLDQTTEIENEVKA
jgi:hypothetical protein